MCIYRLVKIFEDFQDTYMCTLGRKSQDTFYFS